MVPHVIVFIEDEFMLVVAINCCYVNSGIKSNMLLKTKVLVDHMSPCGLAFASGQPLCEQNSEQSRILVSPSTALRIYSTNVCAIINLLFFKVPQHCFFLFTVTYWSIELKQNILNNPESCMV